MLRVRPGRRLGLGALSFEAWSLSPDGTRLAFAGVNVDANFSTPSVRIVDTTRLRVLGRVRLVGSLFRPAPDRERFSAEHAGLARALERAGR